MKIIVNGLEIPSSVFDREFARAKQMSAGTDEQKLAENVRDQLIRQALVRGAALKQGDALPPAEVEVAYRNLTANFGGEDEFLKANGLGREHIDMVKKDVEANVKVERFINELTRFIVLPSEAKLREYHRRDKSVSVAPPEVHCAHIVKRPGPGVYDTLVAIRKKALAGEDFAKIADECTDCNDQGGDLGFVPRGKMVEAFEDVVFSMEPGEVSPVFRSPFGYHVAKVYEFKPERALTYEESAEMVKSAVMTQMKDAVIKDWIDKQLKTANVSVDA